MLRSVFSVKAAADGVWRWSTSCVDSELVKFFNSAVDALRLQTRVCVCVPASLPVRPLRRIRGLVDILRCGCLCDFDRALGMQPAHSTACSVSFTSHYVSACVGALIHFFSGRLVLHLSYCGCVLDGCAPRVMVNVTHGLKKKGGGRDKCFKMTCESVKHHIRFYSTNPFFYLRSILFVLRNIFHLV